MISRPKKIDLKSIKKHFSPTFYNSFSGKLEQIIPYEANHLKMYVCGPTVYERPHLGNARCAVVYDMIFRLFLQIFDKVSYVRNITDIDDKINLEAKKKGINSEILTREITRLYHEDISALNILDPDFEPKVSENIPEIISLIQKIIEEKAAYISSNHVLFDVSSFPDYGKLSGRKLDQLITGARVEVANYKKNPLDFVLWKPADEDDDQSCLFDSPWGRGRPGWHIECSAMSQRFLGKNFDIHGGGADLKFPHHENEIAQSCAADHECFYAKYWIHNGFLLVNGEKMSKSLGNFTTVKDLLEKKYDGASIRLMLLSSNYRKPLDFNDKVLSDSQKTLKKFYSVIDNKYFKLTNLSAPSIEIIDFLCDDLNFSRVVAHLHSESERIKDEKDHEIAESIRLQFASDLSFLGLQPSDSNSVFFESNKESRAVMKKCDLNPWEIEQKLALRQELKLKKDFVAADKIRDELSIKGVKIIDKPSGKSDWYQN